jgi:hypothetical protein
MPPKDLRAPRGGGAPGDVTRSSLKDVTLAISGIDVFRLNRGCVSSDSRFVGEPFLFELPVGDAGNFPFLGFFFSSISSLNDLIAPPSPSLLS